MKNKKIIMAVASGKEVADLVIKNINIIDVFTQSIYKGNVAVAEGYISGIGEYQGREEIDGSGKYIAPSFIDAHMHLESSLVTPRVYESCTLPHGVTSVVADPHELANVAGRAGITYFLEASSECTLDFYAMLPSCVPATPIDMGGAVLKAADIKDFYKEEKVLGLAEVMDFKGVINGDSDMMQKIHDAVENRAIIDGHCAGLDTYSLNTYAAAGISTDHECASSQEVLDRLRRGIYVLMREGTAAKNLRDLAHIVNSGNSRRICLCTDDKHIDEIILSGGIDNAVRIAIEEGIPAITAYQMATLNTAECYGLKDLGAVAPGFRADFIILSDLNKVIIDEVYKNGKLVAKSGKLMINSPSDKTAPEKLLSSVKLPLFTKQDLEINLKKSEVNIIEFIPNKLETLHSIGEVDLEGGIFRPDIEKDLLSLVLIDRFSGKKNIGKGIIKGFSLKEGAIGTTISHDSHNIIIIGSNTEDMLSVLEELERIQGGIVYSKNKKIESGIKLEIGGLITARDPQILLKELDKIHCSLEMGKDGFNPFLALSFLGLSVIPEIKLTLQGLYSSKSKSIIPLETIK